MPGGWKAYLGAMILSVTKVDCVRSMINSSEAGEKGKGDDDAKTLSDHYQLRMFAQLSFFILLCRLVQTKSNLNVK